MQAPRLCAHTVASRSRRASMLGLLCALGAWSLGAQAAPPPGAVHTPEWQLEPPAPPREASYRPSLTASYVFAPVLAVGVGHLLAELEAADSVAALGATTMFLAPAAVHMARGKVLHGPLAFLGLAGSTAVGTLLGGVVGYNLDLLGSCDRDENSDCFFEGFDGLAIGALVGAVTSYTAFAIYDVSANGAVLIRETPSADQASLQLWLSPLPVPKRERAAVPSRYSGLQIVATLRM